MRQFKLVFLKKPLTIYRFEAESAIPDSVWNADFVSISKSSNEVSIVVSNDIKLEAPNTSANWTGFYIEGQLAHDELGILAGISATLAAAHCSIFAISTYDTDYILIPTNKVSQAKNALLATGLYLI